LHLYPTVFLIAGIIWGIIGIDIFCCINSDPKKLVPTPFYLQKDEDGKYTRRKNFEERRREFGVELVPG